MRASGNLPVQLIARSLLMQFVPQMATLRQAGAASTWTPTERSPAPWTIAMGRRDPQAVRADHSTTGRPQSRTGPTAFLKNTTGPTNDAHW